MLNENLTNLLSNSNVGELMIDCFQWVPPVRENLKEKEADEEIALDLGDEYEQALTNASEDEIIDLAGKNLKSVTCSVAYYLPSNYLSSHKNKIVTIYIFLLAILGFHSMMNQDQYHASLLNSGQPLGLGWDGITKASQPKAFPMDPPNDTDVDDTIRRAREDDPNLVDLNWNNIKVYYK